MLRIENKEYRNLQEQVLKNMDDIETIADAIDFARLVGIGVDGILESVDDLPTDPKKDDAYAIGTQTPYEIYAYDGEE